MTKGEKTMSYSEIKELYKNIDAEVIRNYYDNYDENGLSILSAAFHLGIVDDLGNMFEFVCGDNDIEEHKSEFLDHMDQEFIDDCGILQSHNGWWFQLVGDMCE